MTLTKELQTARDLQDAKRKAEALRIQLRTLKRALDEGGTKRVEIERDNRELRKTLDHAQGEARKRTIELAELETENATLKSLLGARQERDGELAKVSEERDCAIAAHGRIARELESYKSLSAAVGMHADCEKQLSEEKQKNTPLKELLRAVVDSILDAVCPVCTARVRIPGGVIRGHMDTGTHERCTASGGTFVEVLRDRLAPSEAPSGGSDKQAFRKPEENQADLTSTEHVRTIAVQAPDRSKGDGDGTR